MYVEEDLLPISALQHFLFCKRQCALIHIEQLWSENIFTAQGKVMHNKVDQGGRESRRDIRLEYGVPLRSLELGLIGKADMLEFHWQKDGTWQPFPVEYKRGRAKKENWDQVQLCAQAICLEEMINTHIPCGALFYGKNRRRQDIIFDKQLRHETEKTAMKLHELIESGITPSAAYSKKCDSCSLLNLCLPEVISSKASVEDYLEENKTS